MVRLFGKRGETARSYVGNDSLPKFSARFFADTSSKDIKSSVNRLVVGHAELGSIV
jgi:hypothetical protein